MIEKGIANDMWFLFYHLQIVQCGKRQVYYCFQKPPIMLLKYKI